MTDVEAPSDRTAQGNRALALAAFRRQLPFVAILILAIGGVAYTNIARRPLVGYWEFLAIAMAFVCVATHWSENDDRKSRFRLMGTQALHWLAVLVAMNITLLSGVQQLMPPMATSVVLLLLLGTGTFLAGVHLLSLELGFLGFALAMAVPAISWFKQSALFFILAAMFVVGLGLAFWSYWGDTHPAGGVAIPSRDREGLQPPRSS